MCVESITTDYKLSRNIALNRDSRFKGSCPPPCFIDRAWYSMRVTSCERSIRSGG